MSGEIGDAGARDDQQNVARLSEPDLDGSYINTAPEFVKEFLKDGGGRATHQSHIRYEIL